MANTAWSWESKVDELNQIHTHKNYDAYEEALVEGWRLYYYYYFEYSL